MTGNISQADGGNTGGSKSGPTDGAQAGERQGEAPKGDDGARPRRDGREDRASGQERASSGDARGTENRKKPHPWHFWNRLDARYLKIACYASVTALLTFLAGIGIYHSSPYFVRFFHLVGTILKPIIAGVVICYLLSPITNFFERRFTRGKKSGATASAVRAMAVLITVLIVLAMIAIVFIFLFLTASRQISRIDFESVKEFALELREQFSELIDEAMNYLTQKGFTVDKFGSILTGIVTGLLDGVKDLFFGFLFAIYFLYDGVNIGRYWKNASDILINHKVVGKGEILLEDADRAFSGYIRGQAIDALLVGILISLSMSIAQVPYAAVIGIIAGFGNLIPYFGPILGYISVILVCVIRQDFHTMIIGLIVMLVIQFVDGNIINPKLLGKTIQVHPLLVIACVLAGGSIGGILGMVIAVPVGALLKTEFDRLLRFMEEKKKTG